MRSPLNGRGLSFLACSLVLMAGGLVEAAIGSPSGSAVLVSARATAGLNIEGKTNELGLTERDGDLVFQLPLAGLDTGIGLRNRHMREQLDVAHFPQAELHVPRKAITFPPPGGPVDSETQGTLTLHGVSKPCSIHYRVEQARPGEYRVHGTIRIDIRDFGIAPASYLGVAVDPSVGIQVDFSAHDS